MAVDASPVPRADLACALPPPSFILFSDHPGDTVTAQKLPRPRPRRRWIVQALIALSVLGLGLALASQSRSSPPFVNHSPEPGLRVAGPVAGESYLWRPVKIGGGGFITGIDFDATGRTMVARTDVHGAYIWDAAADQWQQLVSATSMPAQFRIQHGVTEGVYEIAVAPGNPDRLYMATMGRVFRSDDRGLTWSLPSEAAPFPLHFDANSPYRLYGPFMAVSPTDPNVVFLGTPDQGLWRSLDGGANWASVTGVPPAKDIAPAVGKQSPGIAIWFVPSGPRKGAVFAASPGNGLFVAKDAFSDFRAVSEPGYGPETIARGAFASDGAFFAMENERQRAWVLRSDQWTDLADNGLSSAPFIGVAIKNDRVVVSDQRGSVWCSGNSGKSFIRVYRSQGVGTKDPPWLNAISGGFAAGQILFEPGSRNRLWTASGVGPYWADLGRFCLMPLHWSSQARGIEELVAMDVVQPSEHAPMFATLDFGVHVRSDLNAYSTGYGPRTRVIIAAQQVAITPANRDFAVTNASDTRVGCCTDDGDSILAGFTENGGKSWTKFPSLPTPPGTRPEDPWRMSFGTIAVSAGDTDNIVWVPAYNRAPYYTLDRGKSWHRVTFSGETPPFTGSFNDIWYNRRNLAADGKTSGTFYFLHSGRAPNQALAGFWQSTDGGRTWSMVFQGDIAPNTGGAVKLRAVPGKAGHLFFTSASAGATDLRLRRSIDGGEHWQAIDSIDSVDDIAFGKAAKGASYPAIYISGKVRGVYGIWRSVDEARSWQRLTDFAVGRLDHISVLGADPDVFGRIYIGYVGSGFIYGEVSHCKPAPFRALSPESCSAVEIPVAGG